MASSPVSHPASTPATYVEPWLSGSRTETAAAGRAVLHALDLASDDIQKWTRDLSDDQLNAEPLGLPSIAFHLRHIARSIDRILTYAEGGQLSAEQLALLKAEKGGPASSRDHLLEELREAFALAELRVQPLSQADLETPRAVGRKQLPISLGGALIHVADHTQRHVGQVVTTTRLLQALAAEKAGAL